MMTRIKICGITNEADALLAAKLGADWVGLNFYAKSPRCIDNATARAIVKLLPKKTAPVAVFVEERHDECQIRASGLGIGTVQIYGDHFASLPYGARWIASFHVKEMSDLDMILRFLDDNNPVYFAPDMILVDSFVPGQYGGTGKTAPWHLLADFKPGVPLILAGGLTPDNVAEAIRIVRPYAVDVASGVESSPGKKDADKMRRFIDAVRAID
jgi:phosphoribosylanthranilate isomerase